MIWMRLKGRFLESIKKISRYENIIIALIISFSILTFINPFSYYIYGQDSIPFFGLFTYYQNPLFTFNAGIETLYFSIIVNFLDSIFSNLIFVQDLLLFVGTFLAGIGVFDLLDIIIPVENRTIRITGKILALLFFLYNPFTLSVIWPHLLGWSFLYLLSPFIISFFTDILYNGINIKRFIIVSLLGIVLNMGISGSYLPFFLIIAAVYLLLDLLELGKNIKKNFPVRRYIYNALGMILFVLIVSAWSFLQLYTETYSKINSSFSDSSLLQFFISESSTTTLPNVLSLTAYSWIYYVPSAYPWIGYFSAIQTAGYLIFFLLPFSVIMLSKYRKTLPLTIIAILAVIFSTGNNFPFSFLNEHLLLLRGTFLFLVNAYYFTIQFYVLFLSVLIYFIVVWALEIVPKKIINKKPNPQFSVKNMITFFRNKRFLAVILILIIISISIYPFVTDTVYQPNGDNIDEININNGLLPMGKYLYSNFTSPDYLTLLIPPSSYGATYLLYNNNSTFADSRNLISTVDPYPLIWNNNGYLAKTVENYLSSNNFNGIYAVLRFLHIKYVIFTFDYDKNSSWMTLSPNGKPYNMSQIFNALVKSVGNPMKFGVYYVFTVKNVTPVLGIIQNPIFTNVSFPNYLNFLGSLNMTELNNSQINELTDYTLLGVHEKLNSSNNYNSLSIFPYNPENNYILNYNETFLLMQNGTLLKPSNLGYPNNNGFVNISPKIIAGIYNQSTYRTNMEYNGKYLFSNYSSYITLNENITIPSAFNISFKIASLPQGYRNFFNFYFGNIILSLEFINISHNNIPYVFQITANVKNSPFYAWNNILLPTNLIGKNITLKGSILSNFTMHIILRSNQLNLNNSVYFYFGTNNYMLNPGYNVKALPASLIFNNSYTFYFDSGSNPTYIYNFEFTKIEPIAYIVNENIIKEPHFIQTQITTDIYGNYKLQVNGTFSDSFLYFFDPPASTFIAKSNDHSYTSIASREAGTLIYGPIPISSSKAILVENPTITPISFLLSISEVSILLILLTVVYIKDFQNEKKKKIQ